MAKGDVVHSNQTYWSGTVRADATNYVRQRAELWESMIRGAITRSPAALQELLIGLHNAMNHSDALWHECSEAELETFYAKLEALQACKLVKGVTR